MTLAPAWRAAPRVAPINRDPMPCPCLDGSTDNGPSPSAGVPSRPPHVAITCPTALSPSSATNANLGSYEADSRSQPTSVASPGARRTRRRHRRRRQTRRRRRALVGRPAGRTPERHDERRSRSRSRPSPRPNIVREFIPACHQIPLVPRGRRSHDGRRHPAAHMRTSLTRTLASPTRKALGTNATRTVDDAGRHKRPTAHRSLRRLPPRARARTPGRPPRSPHLS